MATLEELLAESIELEKQKRLLADKTIEINRLIAETKKAKELEKIQLIIIEKVEHNIVYIDTNGTPRTDILEILRNTPSRYYNYINARNEISIQYWSNFLDLVSKAVNVEIK